MTQPIQEPSHDRATQAASWGTRQLFRRPNPSNPGIYYAQWKSPSDTYVGNADIYDFTSTPTFTTNNELMFPSIDGDGVVDVGGGIYVPVIDYYYRREMLDDAKIVWILRAQLHSTLKDGMHTFGVNPHNHSGGGSVGFTSGATGPVWNQTGAPYTIPATTLGSALQVPTLVMVDKASFGSAPDSNGVVEQRILYYRSAHADTDSQSIDFVELWALVLRGDSGVYV